MLDTTTSLAGPSSATLGLRMPVKLAKPASRIGLLCEQLPKVNVFLHIRFSRLGVLLFLIEYLISRSWLCLKSMCSVHCLHEPKVALCFLWFGSREHISDIKLFESKIAKTSFVCCGFTVTLFYATHYVASSFLLTRRALKSWKSLYFFSKCLGLIPVAL